MRLLDLDTTARRQHGLVTPATSNLTRASWYRALRAGHLEQLHPGVARLPGTPDTREQRIAAAVFAAGPGALASHRSAAHLWGIARPDDDPIDLIVPRHRHPRLLRSPSIVVHRPTDTDDLGRSHRHRISCTTAVRMLCDLGAVDPGGVDDAVGHLLASRTVTLGALEEAVERHGRSGRAGIPALRSAIENSLIDGRPADSVLETAMQRLILLHRLPDVEFHPIIEGREVDFRVIGTPILLECDGWRYHGLDKRGFERDRSRDADLIARGWIVVRFTYRSITTAPQATARRIRAACERWSALRPPDAA